MFHLLSRLSRIRLRLKICYPSDNFHQMLLGFGVFPNHYRSYSQLYKRQIYRPYCL
ncbi:hypothetical protein OMAG_002801 [Candidatus Omnitrophus magneticus]|uniref:Uncharacterized protein n=1 Tax=Candidatus Omnitrophus magneticus TaxID=1609969 RepID=A0A0F0CJD5_9BACT|nr:hypothetical protein OMAG_002801 [Candidatus Omnitrophus magneticus]